MGSSPLLNVFISLTTRSIPSSVLNSRIGIPCTMTLYYSSPFFKYLIKGSTPLIISSFWIRKSLLKSGVVLTIILPRIDKVTVEITSPCIPFFIKVLLSKLRILINEKEELAWVFRSCSRVYLLVRASLPFLAFFSVISLGLGLVCFVLALAPFPWFLFEIIIYS